MAPTEHVVDCKCKPNASKSEFLRPIGSPTRSGKPGSASAVSPFGVPGQTLNSPL